MKTKLLILVLMVAVVLPLKGQSAVRTNIPEYEFGASYGLLTPADLSALRTDLGTCLTFLTFGKSDSHIWGTATIDFYHKVSNHFAVGVIAGYNSFNLDYYGSPWYVSYEECMERVKDKYWFVMPAARYYYGLPSSRISLYSGVALGVSYRTREVIDFYPENNYSKSEQFRLGFHVTLAGLQFTWKHLGVFFEYGYGYAGIVRAGLRLRK